MSRRSAALLYAPPNSPINRALQQFAVAIRKGLQPSDWLVLACARPTAPLRELSVVLDRERLPSHGAPSVAERDALTNFRRIARRHLNDADIDLLLSRLFIWPTDPTRGDGHGLLIARLEAQICEHGHGADAAGKLSDIVRGLARMRGGLDGLGLVQALQNREVPLNASVSPGSAVAWARSLAAYRERVVRRGSTLELFGAPPDMADLPVENADANIEVDVNADDRIGHGFHLALRRRGRVLLIGHPGGGKSTALRGACAYWAARPDWPVPMLVHLKRLASSKQGLTDTILDTVCEDLLGDERATLRAALAHEFAAGRCVLALDGLDEVRRGRAVLAGELAKWISERPAGTEVIVSTRPVTIDDGKRLRLPELTLRPPRDPDTTVEAILQAAAPKHHQVDTETWVEERRQWVIDATERDPSLAATPLTVVILALIAARSDDPTQLPRTRARILLHALESVMDRWEIEQRHGDAVTVGPLKDTSAREALTSALRTLSSATLAEQSTTEQAATKRLATTLVGEFTLRPGEARSAAADALHFWIDAGLFSFDGDQLNATLRPLAEVGHASGPAQASEDEPDRWVRETRAVPELWASLALGAGLSPQIAQGWAQAVAIDGGIDELIALANATADGVSLMAEDLTAIIDGCGREHLSHPEDAERAARAILGLPLTNEQRARVRPLLSRAVPAERQAVVEALAITTWAEQGASADQQLRAFIAAKPPARPAYLDPKPGPLDFLTSTRDDAYSAAFEAAAVRIANGSRADAELVVNRFEDGSMEFRSELCSALDTAGHDDLSKNINADLDAMVVKNQEFWGHGPRRHGAPVARDRHGFGTTRFAQPDTDTPARRAIRPRRLSQAELDPIRMAGEVARRGHIMDHRHRPARRIRRERTVRPSPTRTRRYGRRGGNRLAHLRRGPRSRRRPVEQRHRSRSNASRLNRGNRSAPKPGQRAGGRCDRRDTRSVQRSTAARSQSRPRTHLGARADGPHFARVHRPQRCRRRPRPRMAR